MVAALAEMLSQTGRLLLPANTLLQIMYRFSLQTFADLPPRLLLLGVSRLV